MEVACLDNKVCCEAVFPGLNKKLYTRLGYIILNALCLLIALIVGKVHEDKIFFSHSMYSISFTLTLFHLLIILLSLTGTNVAVPLNRGLWTLKFLIAEGIYFIIYFVDSEGFYKGYTKFAKYVCLGYIIYISLVTISFGHFLNVRIFSNVEVLDNAGLSSAGWQALLWGLTIVFYCATVAFYIDIFEETYNNMKALSFMLSLIGAIASLVLTIISISPLVERKRLLTSSYICSFVAYLCWSAMFVNDQPFYSETRDFLDIIFGMTFVLGGLLFIGLTSKKIKLENEEDKLLANNPFLEANDGGEIDVTTQTTTDAQGKEIEVYLVTRSFFLFQGFLLFLSVFYAMLFTHWDTMGQRDWNKGFGYFSKFFTSYAALGFYLWILFASRCCPDRDFDF
ncbi:MAG: serine incorporator domain-containing protein [archaeon]|nr:serine incorporator domain-containing protein [archaeon]